MADGNDETTGTTTPEAAKSAWDTRVGGFAEAVGKNLDDVNGALKPLVGEANDEGLVILSDVSAVPDADLKEALKPLGIPLGKLNMHMKKLRGEAIVKPEVGTTASGSIISVLPPVPDDESFLKAVQTGGVLKIDVTEVLSAVKAGLASKVGLFDVTERIVTRMEEFADRQGEPVGEAFFNLLSMLTERKYGDVFAALGIKGRFMSEGRKNTFLKRIDTTLWPALSNFNGSLKTWYEGWMSTAANPQMMMRALSGAMPKGMTEAPDTGSVRSSADAVVDEINKVFAGVGVPVIRALAYDATRIMSILKEPTLPQQIGTTTRDQMLKELGINVGSDVVRYEQSLTRYTLSIMKLNEVTAENEAMYLTALLQVGNSIPWDKVMSGKAGIGKHQY